MSESALKVEVNAAAVRHDLSRALFGEGLIFGFNYMWDWEHNRTWPKLLEMIKDLNTDVLGHLGGPGVWVHDYHWKNVIGPRESRQDPTPRWNDYDQINNPWGTHEYGLMLEEYRKTTGRDIIGSVQVNIMTDTAENAADWVEYMNGSARTKWGAMRAAAGHADPFNVQYWELGNQPHFTFANIGRLTGVEYARRVREFATAMKLRDPNAKITAYMPFFNYDGTIAEATKLGTAISDVEGGEGSDGLTWTQLVLKEAGEIIDALDYHWYGAVHTTYQPHEFVMSSAYKGLLPNIQRAREMIRTAKLSDRARDRLSQFVCPEYGALSTNGPREKSATAVYGAVANSRLLHVLADQGDVLYAQRFGMFAPYPDPRMGNDPRPAYVAIHGRADGSDFLGTAVYKMKLLWGKSWQQKIVQATIANSPSFSTGVQVLDATAMRSPDAKSLSIVLTNTSKELLRSAVVLNEFNPQPMARKLLVTGELLDDNRWENPDQVPLQDSEFTVEGTTFNIDLPPNSITGLLLKRK